MLHPPLAGKMRFTYRSQNCSPHLLSYSLDSYTLRVNWLLFVVDRVFGKDTPSPTAGSAIGRSGTPKSYGPCALIEGP